MKAVFFDLDDTLIQWAGVESAALLEVSDFVVRTNPDCDLTDVANALSWFFDSAREDLNLGRLSFSQLAIPVCALLEELGVSAASASAVVPLCMDALVRLTEPYDDCTILESLKARFKLGIVTNGPADLQRVKIAKCGFYKVCDLILCSADIGIGKPEPRIYLEALNRLDVRPDIAYMVGNNLQKDVIAPSKLGIMGILLTREPTIFRESWNGPHVSSLYDLSSVLQ